jgi:hypothetical protein
MTFMQTLVIGQVCGEAATLQKFVKDNLLEKDSQFSILAFIGSIRPICPDLSL